MSNCQMCKQPILSEEKRFYDGFDQFHSVCLVNSLREQLFAARQEAGEAKAIIAGMREAVLEFEHRPPDYPRTFIACRGDEVYPLAPDKVQGFFEALDYRWKSDDVKRWSESFRTAKERAESAEASLENLRSWNKLNEEDLKNVKAERDGLRTVINNMASKIGRSLRGLDGLFDWPSYPSGYANAVLWLQEALAICQESLAKPPEIQ